MAKKDYVIVGAGLFGAVCARELTDAGKSVVVVDKRDHIGGNAYDYTNEHGIRIHKYGPHIFHTSNKKVYDWITQFGEWTPYKHKVKAMLDDGSFVTLPVNIETAKKVGSKNIIEIFYRPYSEKMWGMKLEDIDPSIFSRVPIRNDLNEYYFPKDKFQATEFIMDGGHGTGFCIGNVLKYAQRYGKKGTREDARKDLMKVLHYALMQLYVHDSEK